MVTGSKEGVAACQDGGKFGAKDRYALLAEELNIVFCADAEDTGNEGDQGREISFGSEAIEMTRFVMNLWETFKCMIKL